MMAAAWLNMRRVYLFNVMAVSEAATAIVVAILRMYIVDGNFRIDMPKDLEHESTKPFQQTLIRSMLIRMFVTTRVCNVVTTTGRSCKQHQHKSEAGIRICAG